LAKTQFKGKAPFFLPSQNLHKILYTTVTTSSRLTLINFILPKV